MNPHVGVATPFRNSVVPARIRRSKTRVPSRSTVERASGGTASSSANRTFPTVLMSADVHHHASEPPTTAPNTPTTTASVMSTRLNRRRPPCFSMPVSIPAADPARHGAGP
ncbi:hypothetical protein ACFY8V_02035 [Streptomyces californicus]|uniref:hypothetical protein n=1 Tax=Streptomyces californicus TaxID=67351 RepID=UPI0036BECE61